MDNFEIGFGVTNDDEPEIFIVFVADGQIIQQKEITAEVMSVVATKVLAQKGKAIGKMINSDGTVGETIKFTATKIEALH